MDMSSFFMYMIILDLGVYKVGLKTKSYAFIKKEDMRRFLALYRWFGDVKSFMAVF
jgi:hypothetical protein